MGNIYDRTLEASMYNSDWRDFSHLVGKTVLRLRLNDIKDFLTVETDNGNYGFEAYGGGCSSSWFEHFSGVDALIGRKVLSARSIDMDTLSARDEDGLDNTKQYGFRLTTDRGEAIIEMRNESNGYYGGSILHFLPHLNDPELISDF